jgi:hypothetical protein
LCIIFKNGSLLAHNSKEVVVAIRDIQELMGRRVRVDLGADGIYVGEMLELGESAWRGRVRITGVVSPAQHLVSGTVARRGHRPGEFVDASDAQLVPTIESGHATYLAALEAEVNRWVGSHSGHQTSPHAWAGTAMLGALRAAHQAESRRLVSGNWRVVPEEALAAA